MSRKSVPLSLLQLAIWPDTDLAQHDAARRPIFLRRHKADRLINLIDRSSCLARRNSSAACSRRGNDIGFKAISNAASLEVIQ